MTVPGPADHGYLILDRSALGEAYRAPVEAAVADLVRRGWRASRAVEDLQILLGPRARLKVRQVGRRHFLIGDWRGPRPLSTLVAVNSRPADLARAVVGAGWGRYILAWRDDEGRLALLRDPTGAVDCVWWRHGGATLAVAEPPRELDPLLPADLAIDWTVLREIAEAPELLGDRLALTGLTAVNPGTLALISGDQASVPVWRPSTFCRPGVGWDESLAGLAGVVDATVADLVDPHRRVVAELSGGLDSAIVAGSLAATGRAGRARFLNFHGDWREGDERPWAEAVAHRLELDLATVRKPVEAITLRQLRPLGESVRPALQGVDVTYDGEVAARMRRSRATALVTGQGGDAVFFQAPDPAVAADRFRREGLSGLSPAFLGAVGRWTRHSAWTVLGCALGLRATGPRPASGRRHPWLEDIEDLPPAKAGQLRQFVNAQLFWGDCLRARAGDLLHPLLSQPVVEHCLAIPADRLIAGVRDRGLARRAFADRLPPVLIERRNKGDLSCFYGHVTRASLATLKPLLLNGLQVDQGLVDGKALERDLSEDRLIVGPGYNQLLVGAVLEVWAQHWEGRIAEGRRVRVATTVIARPAPRVSNGRYEEGSRMSRGSDQGPHCGAR